jgi:predicted N-acyltransferase
VQKVKMARVTYKIVDSVSKINRDEWDSLFGNIPEGYEFYDTLEKSNLKEFSFYYLILYRNGDILSIAPLFVADFYCDVVLGGLGKNLIGFIRHFSPRFFILKTLFCGSPFAENGVLGMVKDPGNGQPLIHEIVRVMQRFSREKNVPFIIFKDFLNRDAPLLDSLQHKGFYKVDSFPSVRVELDFNSLEEYLGRFSASRRKDLRRKIKKAYVKDRIKIRVVDGVKDIIDDVYKLYLNTYDRGKVKFEFLTKDFFINVSKNLTSHTKYFLYYVEDRLAAFNLCFVYDHLLIDKFIGFDYAIAHQYSLYFVSWCFNIEWCLENSIRFYQVGQTDCGPKIKLGGNLVPLYAYFKHNNFFLNFLMRMLAILLLKPEGLSGMQKLRC